MFVLETPQEAELRWNKLALLQEHYADFDDLLVDVMEGLLGFKCTEVQLDIGEWIANGPQYRMVQAQRGQAKTTIAAIKAVHALIMDPTKRVLIISAGETMANEIATLVIKIFKGMPELECMLPDRSAGDRTSVTSFDLHYTLKGPEKSPSVACVGITSSMQGKRADLLIADDIESQKNSATPIQRDRIILLSKDFVSICSKGEIIWLGTPQSIDSMYNGLPGRGVEIRIWPGRYPTEVEEAAYGMWLAPLIKKRITDDPTLRSGGGPTGERGKAIDPVLLDEDTLTKKEIDQGLAYFNLQHMLNTELSDAQRFPLKTANLRFLSMDVEEKVGPMTIAFLRTPEQVILHPPGYPIRDKMYRVRSAENLGAIKGWYMYVDPSGGGKNGDELAYAITGLLAGRVVLADAGGISGGLEEHQITWLNTIVAKWKPFSIGVEKNFGNGALMSVWRPSLNKTLPGVGIDEVWESGQKELRIIDILEPIIGSGKLLVLEDLIQNDWDSCSQYPAEKRSTYSLFWQLSRITRDRGALIHDDRLDAVASSCRYWVGALAVDDEKAVKAAKLEEYRKLMNNPLGDGRKLPGLIGLNLNEPNALSRHRISVEAHLRKLR